MKIWLPLVLVGALASFGAYYYYSSKTEYCWLAFGPQAKVRVLVRMQGPAISLDLNADGDFNDSGEHFAKVAACKNAVISDADRNTIYTVTSISSLHEGGPPQRRLMVNINIQGPQAYQQYCDIGTHAQAEQAPEAHFDGPLAIDVRRIWGKLPKGLALKRGEKPAELMANIGTFDTAKGCWVVVRTQTLDSRPAFPDGIHPFASLEFPPLEPGGAPIVRRYALDQFC